MKYTVVRLVKAPNDLLLVVDIVESDQTDLWFDKNNLIIFHGDLRDKIVAARDQVEVTR